MGLFDFFKKSPVSFKFVENKPEAYSPWKNQNLPRNDDYAIAAFIAMCERGECIGRNNDDYPRSFSYLWRVYDPIKYHKKVIAEGYLVEATPDIALKKFKVDQLKKILTDNGLSDKGKKDVLIARIIESVDLDSLGLEEYYVPSEKGSEHLKKYNYIFYLSSYGITWEEFDQAKGTLSAYLKPNDVIWHILNNKFNEYNLSQHDSMSRTELFYMAKLLEHEGKYVDALLHYTLSLYYDTSGLITKDVIKEAKEIEIAPGLVEAIHRLKDYYDQRIIEKCYKSYRLPHHYMKRKNFERLLFDIFEDEPIIIKKYI